MKKILSVAALCVALAFTTSAIIPTVLAEDAKNDDTQKQGKVVVLFRDGTTITDTEVNKEIDNVPDQLSAKMSLTELKSFLAWKAAYKKVMSEAAQKSGVAKNEDVANLIAKGKATAAGFLLLEENANKLMTKEALQKHYDDLWDKNFKGTKEFSLVAVTTSDKNVANNMKKSVTDEDSLKKYLETNAATTKNMVMDARPQGMFPPEISEAVLKAGAKTIVGPFDVKGVYMMFYVKSIDDAKKQEFTDEFAENYKKVASKEFIREYTKTLYKKYGVKVFDIENKEIDPFKAEDKTEKKSEKKDNSSKLMSIKDDFVLAKVNGDKVTVADLKKFFKVETLVDEAFISMAQQFNIGIDEVITYAVKIIVDDKVLEKEVAELKYDQKPEVVKKLQEIEELEIQHAYFKANIKVKSEDVKRTFDKFIKSIPDEDKNDNEISVKLLFYDTKEDAAKSLKSLRAGEEKFGTVFKDKTSGQAKSAIDLGYVKKRGTAPELWTMLKKGASGACCKEIVELDGSQFGFNGKNYVIVYIADRRPVTLPSLSNEQEKKYFQKLAEKDKATDLAKANMAAGVKTIDGKSIDDLIKSNPEYVDRMITVLMGYTG